MHSTRDPSWNSYILHWILYPTYENIVLLFLFLQNIFVRVPILMDHPHTPQIFGMRTRQRWLLFPLRKYETQLTLLAPLLVQWKDRLRNRDVLLCWNVLLNACHGQALLIWVLVHCDHPVNSYTS